MLKKGTTKTNRHGIDRYGRNAFINSIIDDDLLIAKDYLKSGVDINLQDNEGWAALHFASQNFSEELILFLLKNKANPSLQDNYGNTPFGVALFNCRGQKTNIFSEFIKFGADPKIKNYSDLSPLDLAEMVDNYDLKQYFPKYFKN